MDNHPKNATPGQSMVVDYEGCLIQHVTYPGETATAAVVNMDMLRRRRADPKFNKLASLRTEIYREMYKPRYPANLYEKGGIPKTVKERQDKLPLQSLLDERIFIPPA